MREPDEPAQPADSLSEFEHDLVNSLASITGFSQLIHRDASLPDDLRHSAGLLVEEAARTRQMVQSLLDTVRQRSTEPPAAVASLVAHAHDVAFPTATTTVRSRVLVVDDDGTFRVFLERALTALGYEPVMASLGADAVEVARRGELAAIVCDHQMPGMSGIQVYDAITADAPDLADRFVMMSGDVGAPAVIAFAATHSVTFLAKPFDLETLDRTLRSVIDGSAQPRG